MLPKTHRLTQKDVAAGKPSRTVRGEYLTLRAYPTPFPRFAVVVSKKVARSSVTRHRIKRRVYAALALLVTKGVPLCGMWYPTAAAKNVPFVILEQEVTQLAREALR